MKIKEKEISKTNRQRNPLLKHAWLTVDIHTHGKMDNGRQRVTMRVIDHQSWITYNQIQNPSQSQMFVNTQEILLCPHQHVSTPHKHPTNTTNTPQTPRRPVSSLHTHTHTTPTPASPPPRASGCACITLRKPPKQAKADLSGHQKRPINRMHHSIARPVRRRVDSPASASHQRESALAPALSRRQPRSRCGARRLQVHAAPAHIVREAAAHASDAARTRRDPARTRREGGPAHERQ